MEAIRIYLENMFAALPKSDEILRVKQELLCTMEDKYTALKAEGKSENEAVGTVISEFGNIDELLEELDVQVEKKEDAVEVKAVGEDEAREYLRAFKKHSRLVATGVMLILFAVAAFLLLSELLPSGMLGFVITNELSGTISVAVLIMLIAVAVALFIVSGISFSRFEDYEEKQLCLSDSLRAQITAQMNAYTPKFAVYIVSGILCFFAAPVALILISSIFPGLIGGTASVSALLALIGIGLYLVIRGGMRKSSYEILLGIDEDSDEKREKKMTKENSKANRITEIFSSILWPLVIIAYLLWSFLGGSWGISWILFPIAALLTAAVSGVAQAVAGKDK